MAAGRTESRALIQIRCCPTFFLGLLAIRFVPSADRGLHAVSPTASSDGRRATGYIPSQTRVQDWRRQLENARAKRKHLRGRAGVVTSGTILAGVAAGPLPKGSASQRGSPMMRSHSCQQCVEKGAKRAESSAAFRHSTAAVKGNPCSSSRCAYRQYRRATPKAAIRGKCVPRGR